MRYSFPFEIKTLTLPHPVATSLVRSSVLHLLLSVVFFCAPTYFYSVLHTCVYDWLEIEAQLTRVAISQILADDERRRVDAAARAR
jgi:hypothetical protein